MRRPTTGGGRWPNVKPRPPAGGSWPGFARGATELRRHTGRPGVTRTAELPGVRPSDTPGLLAGTVGLLKAKPDKLREAIVEQELLF